MSDKINGDNSTPSCTGGSRYIDPTWASNPRNPHNWSTTRKSFTFLMTMMAVLNSSMGSSLASNVIPFITKEFDVESELQKVLPMSMFLIGYVFGPLVWAPLSEEFGRRFIMMATFALFTLFTLSCAVAPNWSSFLGFRLLTGIFGSSPVALGPGILADIYQHPRVRGWGIATFMAATGFGPMLGPVVSGFASPILGWRWSFYIALMFAGVTLALLMLFPETYAPTLLANFTEVAQGVLHPESHTLPERKNRKPRDVLTRVLLRPLHFLISELIVSACSGYLALCYSIFYMSFQAFPLIFEGLYGLSLGQCSLVQLTVAIGCVLALPVHWMLEEILRRAQAKQRPWAYKEEYRRLPLACVGGPLFAISLFWLGWAARWEVHFTVPMVAGIPFGMGFMCIFIALLNYMTDAYEIYAASAAAASSCTRSFFATLLPLATVPMFNQLGISGALSLLGGLSTLMSIIPFIFIWKGERIRAKSKFCNALKRKGIQAIT